jgi:hypothetical protein
MLRQLTHQPPSQGWRDLFRKMALMVARCRFFVDTPHQVWVCFEQKN